MHDDYSKSCESHCIFEENMDVYNSDFLEITNQDITPMVKNVEIVNNSACPIFFNDIRSELQKKYVSIQRDAFHNCINVMKKYNFDNFFNVDESICEKIVSIFYAFLSKNTFLMDIYWDSFLIESRNVDEILSRIINENKITEKTDQ